MKRLSVLVVVVALLLAALSTTAIVLVVADRDDTMSRNRPGMMYPRSGEAAPDWWNDGPWGPMMGSMMGSMMAGRWADTDSEAEYLAEMVAHHQEAVRAARELSRSERPQLQAFGQAIVTTQSAQIEQMTSWLEDWYPDVPETEDYQPMMRDLAELSGDRLDQVFLEDMIGHHMAAVMMSQHLLWQGTEHAEVTTLARSIRDDQHTEIVQMQRWLAEWFDADWRGGMGMGWGIGPGRPRRP